MNRLYVFHPIGYLIEFQPFVGMYLGASSDGMTATSSIQRGGVQSLKSHWDVKEKAMRILAGKNKIMPLRVAVRAVMITNPLQRFPVRYQMCIIDNET